MQMRKLSVILLSLFIFLHSGFAIANVSDYYSATDNTIIEQAETFFEGGVASLSDQGEFEILVSYAHNASRLEKDSFNDKYSVSEVEEITNGNIFRLSIPGDSLEEIISSLKQETVLDVVQPNYVYILPDISTSPEESIENSPVVEVLADPETSSVIYDTLFGTQWGMQNIGQNGGTAGIDIDALTAWNTTTGDQDIIVAVMDTGVDIEHPDLISAIWQNPDEISGDGIDNDNNGYVDDIHGWDYFYDLAVGDEDYLPHYHGTHVAGIISAQHNEIGVRGVAPDVSIMVLNFMGYSSPSSDPVASTTTAEIVKAINYAQAEGARIMNTSWGTSAYDQVMHDAMAASNMLFVAAAGNDGVDVDTSKPVSYPAAFDLPNLISVAAINRNGTLAEFSSYGAQRVHIAAPGKEIVSTIPVSSEYSYASISGTSMAAPHVSGIAAVLLSYKPELSASDLKNIIISSNKNLPSLEKTIFSAGMADAKSALDLAALHGTADYSFQVIFRDWDGTILKTTKITPGGTASPPPTPARSGYTFAAWNSDLTNIQKPMSIYATYTANSYTAVFQDWDGSIVKSEKVSYGGNATAPAVPVRTNYIFTGWDSSYNNITSSTRITARYEQNRLITTSSSSAVYDEQGKFVLGFSAGSKISSLYTNFSNPAEHIRVVTSDGTVISDRNRLLGTGMKLQLYNSNLRDQKEIIIRGDVNGDGQISALDLLQVKQHLLGRNRLQTASYEAGKINGQEQVTALDLLQMKKHLLRQIEIR